MISKKILVIEDSKTYAQIIADLLKKEGYSVEIAITGKQAFQLLSENKFNLIILDLILPDTTGEKILKHVRETKSSEILPIIILSSIEKENKIVEMLQQGANDFLTKPFSELIFKTKTKNILEIQQKTLELKQAKDEYETLSLELKELNATKDKFFGIIAHDLKNPFNSLLGFSSLLANNTQNYSPEKVQQFAQVINSEATQGYKLLENLLEWSLLQTGNTKPNRVKIKPSDLLNEVKILNEQISKTKNINLQLEINSDNIVVADEKMIQTVLRNLTSNALKFTKPGGSIKIKTETIENNILFEVSDTGLGIDSEHLSKLFRIENKLSKTGTANEKGTGLGLILCKEFVENNNGKIWAESELGKGSNFKFIIPCEHCSK